MQIKPGQPYPFGATWDDAGVNFAVFSENATAIDLCLFDASGQTETHCISMQRYGADVWHIRVEGLSPDQLYGYRAHGPHAPSQGHRFNPHTLLIDPYARALSSAPCVAGTLSDAHPTDTDRAAPDLIDTTSTTPKSVVVKHSFDWQGDQPPRIPWRDTVIYECHVKGLTAQHPDVPDLIRGTYLGVCHPAIIAHIKGIGATALELLPVHQSLTEPRLTARGLHNYWGYNTAAFFAPDLRFACARGAASISEFQTMVRTLHAANLEVLLDVVYNHTAEAGNHGPVFSLRGFDNANYYHLDPHDRSHYRDYSGCGNSLNCDHSRVLQLIVDSLRYWVQDMHVDGFRFDLAPELCREPSEFNRHARLFAVLKQDPVLAGVKLIAEPWDVGPGGYQLGFFPAGWAEWNDKFRDTVRRFWRGDDGQAPELASRLTGSSDVFSGRSPQASINFISAHDGFTLRDLTSFDRKHNEANHEHNNDGHDHNFSYNWGVEGPSTDPEIRRKRNTAMRSMLATLMLSQGVPMLSGGDEIGRTQKGNNNAYCQDNAVSWLDWQLDDEAQGLHQFVRELTELRKQLRVLHRERFFSGKSPRVHGARDLVWLSTAGRELTRSDWSDSELHTLGMLVDGSAATSPGESALADTILVWLNAEPTAITCTLPRAEGTTWTERLNSAGPARGVIDSPSVEIAPFALALLLQTPL